MNKFKRYCPIPFFSVELNSNEHAKLCCNSGHRYTMDGDLKHFWHSDKMKDIRKNMLDDKYYDDCQLCYQREELFNDSKRLDELVRQGKYYKTPLAFPTFLQLNLSNICNLKCIMCSPKYSTKWNEDVDKLKGMRKNLVKESASKLSTEVLKRTIKDFIETRSFAEKTVEIYGGEPFLSKEFWKIISEIPYKKLRNVIFRCNTNGTILNKPIMDGLKKFKKAMINFSIDGIGDVFEFQRFPANWEKVKKNILYMKEFDKRFRFKFKCDLYFTLTSFSGIGLKEFLDFCKKHDFEYYINIADNEPLIDVKDRKIVRDSREDLNEWEEPEYFGAKGFTHPSMLPEVVKEQILSEVESMLSHANYIKVKNSFSDTKVFNVKMLNQFPNYCELLKQVRGLDFLKMLEERYNYAY